MGPDTASDRPSLPGGGGLAAIRHEVVIATARELVAMADRGELDSMDYVGLATWIGRATSVLRELTSGE